MPAPIDYDQPLNGTMAAYAQQLLICTGQRDWTSRIEEDGQGQSWGEMVRGLKSLLGRGGKYADVSHTSSSCGRNIPLTIATIALQQYPSHQLLLPPLVTIIIVNQRSNLPDRIRLPLPQL